MHERGSDNHIVTIKVRNVHISLVTYARGFQFNVRAVIYCCSTSYSSQL